MTTLTRLIALFVIARFATPVEFGAVAFALAFAEVAKVIADFGVDTLAIRQFAIAKKVAEQQSFAKTVAVTKLICSTAVYIATASFFLLSEPLGRAEVGLVTGLLIFTSLASNLSITYFQAHLRSDVILLPVVITNVSAIIVIGVLLLIEPNILLGIAVLPIAEAVNAWLLYRRLRREINPSQEQTSMNAIRRLLLKSLPIAITAIMVNIYSRLDVFALSNFSDKAAVGYYGIAFRMTEPLALIAGGFSLSLYSQLSAVVGSNHRQGERRFILKYGIIAFTYALVACATLIVLGPTIIEWLLPAYIEAVPISKVLAVALIFRVVNPYLTGVLLAYGRFKQVTAITACNLISITVLLVILVPQLGAIGAAAALLIGEMMNTAMQMLLVKRVAAR